MNRRPSIPPRSSYGIFFRRNFHRRSEFSLDQVLRQAGVQALAAVRKNVGRTAEEIIFEIIRAADEFRNNAPQDDDITAVVIKAVDRE